MKAGKNRLAWARMWPPSRAALKLAALWSVPSAVLLGSLFFLLKPVPHPAAEGPTALAVPSAAEPAVAMSAASNAPILPDLPAPVFDEEAPERPSRPAPPEPVKITNVQQAAQYSCSTDSVDGLNRQLVEQLRCISPKAFVAIPARPNLKLDGHVFALLEVGTRDRLVRALDAHKHLTMTVNSALRTLAQQYLVWRWSDNTRCGVQLATAPGDSNHEAGLAVDVATPGEWRKPLEGQGFHWLGASDRVHFEFAPKGTTQQKKPDVLAFQRLWNRNHPDELIAEDGRYTPETELRLKRAPADGFAIGPSCSARRKPATERVSRRK